VTAGTERPARQVRAEAASWVARLHGPDRDARTEDGFRKWLAEDAVHAKAFELATEVWQETSDLPARLPGATRSAKARRTPRQAWRPLLIAAAALPLAVALAFFYHHASKTLATEVGEQRTLTLADGTRVELNTSTQLLVRYDNSARKVILKSGEAWFDVAPNAQRPFIVVAGGQEIRAVGTVFVVRKDEDALTVTLLEGHVAVRPERAAKADAAGPQVLNPGQRLRVARLVEQREQPVIDSPALETVTAWQRGQVVFEDTPLGEAAMEFNRYSDIKIHVEGDLAKIRVGGTFRVGDMASFAQAIADSHGLKVIHSGQQVLLLE
jgi:transmembrane sensor